MRKYTALEYFRVMVSAAFHAQAFYARPYQTPEQTQQFQLRRLQRLVKHAYETTNLYRQKYDRAGVRPADLQTLEDLRHFPTVTKQELIDAFPAGWVSKSVDRRNLIRSISSGSSGAVITVFHQPADTWAYVLGRFRILNLNNSYHPFDRVLYLYTSPYPAQSFFGLYRSWFMPTLLDLESTSRQLLRLRPHIISSYPSHLLMLRSYLSTNDRKRLPLKLISVGSELSTPMQRNELADFYGCPVYDEYSSEELGWIAAECNEGRHHLWEDISYIEILNQAQDQVCGVGSQGEIVGTNLWNFAMPFIRYQQGDLGIMAPYTTCPCGRRTRFLQSFVGRRNDSFVFLDGTVAHSAYLLDATYKVLLEAKVELLDFRLVQESTSVVHFTYVSNRAIDPEENNRITSTLQPLFPNTVTVLVSRVQTLEKTESGKRNPIISRVHHDGTRVKYST